MRLSLKEKFYGSLYGGAIGDALGLGTEFMSPAEISRRYPEGLRDYRQIVRDAHRSQWDQGQWTNDTEIIISLLETVIDRGDIDAQAFAKAIHEWFLTNPVDIVPQVRWVVSQPDYLDDPAGVAERVWLKMGRHNASNEALQRAVLCGAWKNSPEETVGKVCRITHPDTRCICAASIVAHMAHALVYDDRVIPIEELIQIAHRIDKRVVPYIEMTDTSSIEDLKLADPATLWYVRKCMACAIWALHHTSSPAEALHAVVMAGGDADTNASVAMSLIGLRDGFEALPSDLVDGLTEKERLDSIAARFYPILEQHIASQNQ